MKLISVVSLLRAALPPVVLAVLALGCNGTIDGKKVEELIKTQAADLKLKLASVSCPATSPNKRDATFNCTAADDVGTQANITVTILDPAQGSFSWKADLPYEKMQIIGDEIELKLMANTGKKYDVKCPENNIFIKVGAKFVCDASHEDSNVKIELTFKDEKGTCDTKVIE